MYNLDRYIADFLLNNKKLSAQGLGDFAVVNGQAVNGAPQVEFSPNKQAYTSDELISFVAEQEHKNKIVTGFDLESHFNQVKQFINIGTPWIVPGLGQLQLGKNRELEFVQQAPAENIIHERIKRKQASAEPQYATYETGITPTPPDRSGNTGTIILTLLIILALGAGGYYYYTSRNSEQVVNSADTTASVTDTVVTLPSAPVTDTAISRAPAATTPTASEPASSAPAGFHFVLNKTVNPVYAKKRFAQLKSYGTKVYMDSVKKDSYSLYKIYLVKDAPPSDTTRLRDSLTKYYGKPVTIEMP